MTPDPPEPPTPTGRSYTLYLQDTLNNAHMVRIYAGDLEVTSSTNLNELINGTRIDNAGYQQIVVDVPATGDYYLSFMCKAYNNSYTSYTDSYYDDSTSLKINSQSGVFKFNIGSLADGTGVICSVSSGTDAISISY